MRRVIGERKSGIEAIFGFENYQKLSAHVLQLAAAEPTSNPNLDDRVRVGTIYVLLRL